MDTISPGLGLGSCIDATDCLADTNVICYALTFTPTFFDAGDSITISADSLLLTSYTTFFRIDCAMDEKLSIVSNESCIMVDNSTNVQFCPSFEQRFNCSGNSGNTYVKPDEEAVLHQVCFTISAGNPVTPIIREPPMQNVQSNASLGTTPPNVLTENLDVAEITVTVLDCGEEDNCTNGILDGDEEFVDCGGSCIPCTDCIQESITISDSPMADSLWIRVNNMITSDGLVAADSLAYFQAGQLILLEQGFECELGSTFKAYIDPCD